ncbi:MAG: gliding motility-associated C-terminal domain-containing protein [Flavobacteriales bacterium]|nr:gliding motility-associated C-terminal domain-containing protein [Flavobacteriales bacterium]
MPKSLLTIAFALLSLGAFSQTYFLQGNAIFLGDDCYRLTTTQTFQNGAVWYADQIDLTEPFDISFLMNLGNIDGNGADGICFVLQTVGNNALGDAGGGLGFLGFSPAFGIEFDTWSNTQYGDPLFDHIGMISNGDVSHISGNAIGSPVQTSQDSFNVEDGEDHQVRIIWDPTDMSMEVYWDCVFRTSETIDLINDIFNGQSNVYWGFTAATGGSFNNQTVCLQENILTSQSDVFLCEGGTVELNPGGDPEGNFTWSPETFLDDPSAQNPVCSATEDIEYAVTFSDDCGLESTAIINVDVEALEVSISGGELVSCASPASTLTASNNLGNPSTYSWTTDEGNFITGTTASSVVVDSAGVYTVTVNYDGQCESTFEFVVEENFEVNEPLIIDVGEISCYTPEATIIADGDGTTNFGWLDAGGTLLSDSNELNTDQAGNYVFFTVHPESGCENSVNAAVVDNVFFPEIFPGFSDTLTCTEPTLQIEGVSVSPSDVDLQWVANPGLITNGQNSFSPTVALEGLYTLTATIQSNGCSSSATVEIFEDEDTQVDFSSLIIPNVFTPNSDGTNDVFVPYLATDQDLNILSLFQEYDLQVYNRWGTLIFETTGRPQAWDGRDSANEINEGVYYFILDYSSACGGSPDEPITGTIQLMR